MQNNRQRNMPVTLAAISVIFIAVIIYILPLIYCNSVLNTIHEYPEDKFLETATNKKAIIIVAHDDDWYGCVGTIKNLCNNGWDVSAYCFYPESLSNETSIRVSRRKEGLLNSKDLIGLKEFIGIDINLRFNPVEKPYRSLPYSEFEHVFMYDSIETYVTRIIDQNNPSIVFTLDDSIGLYGNPEHVLISQIILDICEKGNSEKKFIVDRIYQSVLPPDMAEGIMVKYSNIHPFLSFKRLYWHLTNTNSDTENIYTEAKKVYGCAGMPLPDIEINIGALSKYKKGFTKCFPTERKNFKRFVPFFNWYPYWIYYRIFDKEFYRIIEI